MTIRGQQTWRGLHKDPARGLEVGESNSLTDYFRNKYRDNNDENTVYTNIENLRNKKFDVFVTENAKSKWAVKDSNVHQMHSYIPAELNIKNRERDLNQNFL